MIYSVQNSLSVTCKNKSICDIFNLIELTTTTENDKELVCSLNFNKIRMKNKRKKTKKVINHPIKWNG